MVHLNTSQRCSSRRLTRSHRPFVVAHWSLRRTAGIRTSVISFEGRTNAVATMFARAEAARSLRSAANRLSRPLISVVYSLTTHSLTQETYKRKPCSTFHARSLLAAATSFSFCFRLKTKTTPSSTWKRWHRSLRRNSSCFWNSYHHAYRKDRER